MTISSATRKAGPYTGNSSATSFAFAFKLFATTDLVATLSDGTAETVLVLGSTYSVNMNADQDANPGGTVTYPLSGSPLDSSHTLTLAGALADLQPTALENQGGFYPKVIEHALDRAVILVQQIHELVRRSIVFPISDNSPIVQIPTAATRANTLLGFDAQGNPTAFIPSSQSAAGVMLALGMSSGSAAIGFLQDGLNAQVTTVQAKLRGMVSVKDFGAVGDGVADDTIPIQRAIASVLNGGTVYFPRGVYKTTATIYVPYGVILWGCGAQHTPNIAALTAQGSVIYGVHTGAAVVSFKGAYNGGLCGGLVIIGDSVTTPKTGLCLGRSSAASAGRHRFDNINVVGYFTKAAVYSIASEENVWTGLKANVLGGGAQFTFFTAETDSQVVDTLTAGGNFTLFMDGFNILNQADYTGQSKPTFAIYVQADAKTQSLNFNGGFTGMTSQCTDSSHIRVELTATCLGDIAFRDIGCESSNSAAPPIQNIYLGGAGFVLPGLVIDNVSGGQVESGQVYHIKAQGGLELNAPYIHCSKTDHPTSLSIVRGGTVNVNNQDLHIDYISEGCQYFARQLYLIETAGGDTKNNIALCPTFVGPIAFGGGAVNDMSINASSVFTGTVSRAMVVYIDASTTPNTFKYSQDGGSSWVATGIAITGGQQALTEGIVIKFVATTGHLTGSQWSWTAKPNAQFI